MLLKNWHGPSLEMFDHSQGRDRIERPSSKWEAPNIADDEWEVWMTAPTLSQSIAGQIDANDRVSEGSQTNRNLALPATCLEDKLRRAKICLEQAGDGASERPRLL